MTFKEQIDLAETYYDDGAPASAARVLRTLAAQLDAEAARRERLLNAAEARDA